MAGRNCLGPAVIGQRLHKQCKCKERAAEHFRAYSQELKSKAERACNENNNLQTASEFAMAMNLTEQEIIELYGVDIDPTNGTTIKTEPENQKLMNFLIFIFVVVILFFGLRKIL